MKCDMNVQTEVALKTSDMYLILLTLLNVCAGGQQAGGAVRSWHHVCAGISGEVHGSVRLIARSDPGRNVLHAVRWVAGEVLTQVCVMSLY